MAAIALKVLDTNSHIQITTVTLVHTTGFYFYFLFNYYFVYGPPFLFVALVYKGLFLLTRFSF